MTTTSRSKCNDGRCISHKTTIPERDYSPSGISKKRLEDLIKKRQTADPSRLLIPIM